MTNEEQQTHAQHASILTSVEAIVNHALHAADLLRKLFMHREAAKLLSGASLATEVVHFLAGKTGAEVDPRPAQKIRSATAEVSSAAAADEERTATADELAAAGPALEQLAAEAAAAGAQPDAAAEPAQVEQLAAAGPTVIADC